MKLQSEFACGYKLMEGGEYPIRRLFCIHVHIAFNTKADAGSELIKVHWLWIPIEFNNEIYSHVWRLLAFLLCSTTTTMATAKKTVYGFIGEMWNRRRVPKIEIEDVLFGRRAPIYFVPNLSNATRVLDTSTSYFHPYLER